MEPWRDWYHVNGNTYGTWLRGDERGWRARHHREHVIGDYKSPPPKGMYDALKARSRSLMTRPEVHLSPRARRLACETFAHSLEIDGVQAVAICIDDHHFHTLARFPDHDPRTWIGRAKRRSAKALSDAGLVERGGVWAIRCRCLPVKDRDHQVAVARYIIGHARRGSAVWRSDRASRPRE